MSGQSDFMLKLTRMSLNSLPPSTVNSVMWWKGAAGFSQRRGYVVRVCADRVEAECEPEQRGLDLCVFVYVGEMEQFTADSQTKQLTKIRTLAGADVKN